MFPDNDGNLIIQAIKAGVWSQQYKTAAILLWLGPSKFVPFTRSST